MSKIIIIFFPFLVNLVKDDSYISSKEEGVDRLKDLVCSYRNNKGMIEWDYEKTDSENHAVVMDAADEAKKDKHHDEQKSGMSCVSSLTHPFYFSMY